MISRFFFPEALPAGGEVRLPEALAHHAARVLRLQDGDAVVLFDGRGGEVPARLAVSGRQWSARLEAVRVVERESPLAVVLVQALASGDKMDWIVQKATELGAAGVVPVTAARSVLRLAGERAEKRLAHWRQVAVAACEQCGRNRLPDVEPIVALDDYLAAARTVRKLVLAPEGGRPLRELAPPRTGEPLHLLIGPEGGWSDAELAACLRAGAEPLGLGPRVLRTETAGLAALAALQALWGDF
ncbi:16S rRNA (uracil(1498)-N(3))-methyltransferase [Pseudothauera rhizosphaerae]|uniref:Ribosomal RNA small subunit methyltransferase E n=1 Tax=Pseudothauera rhizosphaerae TaxID=2565932 RepID=A0A4S4ANJ2_9RHOO|nr:16S rRNA (uracil(1498)-N(3))-methyltransferase [Pseudothauera rhizosphaerae]THF60677.1 16S rRNA (uracil(1498)-N(3))-methyltransferase [Pseudothauera rhizosphaerae]